MKEQVLLGKTVDTLTNLKVEAKDIKTKVYQEGIYHQIMISNFLLAYLGIFATARLFWFKN